MTLLLCLSLSKEALPLFVATEIIYGLVIPAFVGVSVIANALICCVLTFTGNGNGKESSLSFDRVTTFIKLGLGALI